MNYKLRTIRVFGTIWRKSAFNCLEIKTFCQNR